MRNLTMRLAVVVLVGFVPTRKAKACVNDSECKGERICSKSICSAPPATATATATPTPTPIPDPVMSPTPAPLVVVETVPATQVATSAAPTEVSAPLPHPEQHNEGDYSPALGFRCLVVGQSGCAFELRPLAFAWSHADLHADALMGAFAGGDVGVGVGTPYWQVSRAVSSLAVVFRWDFDAIAIEEVPTAGNALLELGLQSGPRFGFSYAVSREVALEWAVNAGILAGYGFALTSTGTSQVVLDGVVGATVGVRL